MRSLTQNGTPASRHTASSGRAAAASARAPRPLGAQLQAARARREQAPRARDQLRRRRRAARASRRGWRSSRASRRAWTYTIAFCRRRSVSRPTSNRWAISRAPSKSSTPASQRGDPTQVLLGITGSGKTFTMAQRHARRCSGRRWSSRTTRRWPRQLYDASSGRSSPTTPSTTSSATTTTTSPRRTSRRPTRTSRRTRSINEEIDRMRHAATYALLTRRDVAHRRVGVVHLRHRRRRGVPGHEAGPGARASRCGATRCCAGWSRSSTSATTSTSTAARSACAATRSRSSRRTSARRRSASSSSATRSTRSPRSTRCAARCCASSTRCRSSRARTTSRRAERLTRAMTGIKDELRERLVELKAGNKLLEAQRLEQRTLYDLEMLEQMGCCKGIENYSRHLSGRAPGEPPPTLLDYFPKDYLLFVDESHQTVPQIGAMYSGDRSRKETLVDFGFRLPSRARQPPAAVRRVGGARRPGDLRVAPRPAEYELDAAPRAWSSSRSSGRPACSIPRSRSARSAARSTTCSARSASASSTSERVLVTTLTKRMAEDLTEYYSELGVRVRYLHSRHRHARAHRDPARPAAGRVRRAGRHQPAARGPRPARGVAGRDPRRRQGGLPALRSAR